MATFEATKMLFHLTLVQTLHGQSIQNGYYFWNNNTASDTLIPSILSSIITKFIAGPLVKIKAFQSQEVVHRTLIATTLWPKNGPIAEQVLETSQGIQTSEALPSYSAAVLSLRSGFGGKSFRGRSYYAGCGIDFASQSRLDTSFLTALQDIGDQLLSSYFNSITANSSRYVICSRKLSLSEDGEFDSNFVATPVTQTIARSVLGTQRHRLIGIGN